MYATSFGLTEAPFSISPDPRFLYMSRRHQEAMAHLRYGIQESGGFVVLTGEVGTGKTTICRSMLEELPNNVDVALILNPQISHNELLAALCDEIGVPYPESASPKQLLDVLNERLIETFAQGRRTVLVIDEAQLLSRVVLEQIRILTNLETTRQKLLQIILIGQPELAQMLSRQNLRQLAQRITARYHLEPLSRKETSEYVRYRLGVAGCHRDVFTGAALHRLYGFSKGIPRLINVICDRALLGAYSSDRSRVTAPMISRAAREVLGGKRPGRRIWPWAAGVAVVSTIMVAAVRPPWMGVDVSRIMRADAPPVAATGEGARAGETMAASMPEASGARQSDNRRPEISLPELMNSSHAVGSEREALARLLRFWGIATTSADNTSCERIAETYGLLCLKGQGSWRDLETYNRVAAVSVREAGRAAYLVVSGLGRERVTVAGRDAVFVFDKTALQRHWEGDYLLLWRAPPNGTQALGEKSEGVDVLWLRQMLNRVPGLQPLELSNVRFDAALKERIMAFQKSNDLHADGVAEVHTIIRLNSIVDPDVPKLSAAAG